MELRIAFSIGLGIALLSCTSALAEDAVHPLKIKTGMWISTIVTHRTGSPSKPIAARTPEEVQRRAREAAQTKPVELPPQTRVVRNCVTKDDLTKSFGGYAEERSCKRTVLGSTAKSQEFHIECLNQNIVSSGTVTMEAPDPEHVNGKVNMTMQPHGQLKTLDMTITAKWVSEACQSRK